MDLIGKIYAADIPALTPITGGTTSSIGGLFTKVTDWILIIAGALAVVYLLYSGILYITSAGNAEQAKKAQQGILNAIIGIIVILLAYFIVYAVANKITS